MNDYEIENMSEYDYKKHKDVNQKKKNLIYRNPEKKTNLSKNEYKSLNKPQDYIRSTSITSTKSSPLPQLEGFKKTGAGQENSLCP